MHFSKMILNEKISESAVGLNPDVLVLVKGSHAMKLENLVNEMTT